jgi:hypothetical protein
VHLRASANLRIDLSQLLVSDGSEVCRLFPYVRQLAAVEMGRLLLIPNRHTPQFVRYIFASRDTRLQRWALAISLPGVLTFNIPNVESRRV